MNNNNSLNDLLSCAIKILGRLTIPPEKVLEILGNNKKLIEAYNLSDGTRLQKDVVKKLRLDQSSFSVTSNRWVKNGIAFWIGDGNERRLLHLYPLPETPRQKTVSKKK